MFTWEISIVEKTTQIARSQRRKTLRAPRIAAPSPLTHCRTRARASAAPNDARTQAKDKSSPKMISKLKLITALALLGLHGAAGDDLCAPASTSAARRVYAVARRAPLTAPHAGPHRPLPRRTTRPRRRRPRRLCRAGALQRRNSTIPSKTRSGANWTSLEPPALRIGCAPAYQWTGQRHGAWPWALRRAACPRTAPESPPPHGST